MLPALGCDDRERLETHVLNRLGYGPDAFSRARVRAIGVNDYIEEQLHPDQLPDPELDRALASLPALHMSYAEIRSRFAAHPGEPLMQLQQARVARAVASRRQLEAVLTDVWLNHFNVFPEGPAGRAAVVTYERDAIREHVLGRFEDMLKAVSRSPAMLIYLDNYLNGGPSAGKRTSLNENYARELLELHTLGRDAGWTQQDVTEVARCLSGWTIDRQGVADDGFAFLDDWHDPGRKVVLGRLVLGPNGGMSEGDRLLEFLARQPATATRVAEVLIRRLVSEDPPPALVRKAANVYLRSHGQLREVVRAILASAEFRDPRHFRSKFKRPLVFTASWVRATGARLDAAMPKALADLRLMGESPHYAVLPVGYPDSSEAWLGADALFERFETVRHVRRSWRALGIRWGVQPAPPAALLGALTERLGVGPLSPETRALALLAFANPGRRSHAERLEHAAGLLLASPEFQRH